MMSVIFTTIDQKFYYSIICKNTDIFANLVGNYLTNILIIKINQFILCRKVLLLKNKKP